ncbi:MAG TPA: hypothetical protein VKU41_28660 [Polyangiaceae bacterium]|nr:hypothetical protein [Polyangiaceae bacterium]
MSRSSASRVAALSGALTLLAAAASASADVVAVDKLAVLPAGPAAAPTSDVPASIPAGEHVDGIFTALAPAAQRKQTEDHGYRYVGIFPTDAQARAYATDGSFNVLSRKEAMPAACLSTGGSLQPGMRLMLRTKPYEPPKPSAAQIEALKKAHRWPPPPPPKPSGPPRDAVQRLRLEKLTQDGDTVTIETTDAMLDLQTMGARLVSKSSAKLSRVVTGPSGLGVFAARDDKGQTEFLVTAPEIPPPPTESDRPAQLEALSMRAASLVAQTPSSASSASGCGRVRFTLAAKAGSGQMATVIATAFLPPATEPDEGPATDDSDGDGEPDDEGFIAQQTSRRGLRKQRARPLAVNVSLSQLASESAPLLSVTFGWAGKNQDISF